MKYVPYVFGKMTVRTNTMLISFGAAQTVVGLSEPSRVRERHYVFLVCTPSANLAATPLPRQWAKVADTLLQGGDYNAQFRAYYRRYPSAGYGNGFHVWTRSRDSLSYNCFGNGSAMRVSPVAAELRPFQPLDSLDETDTWHA